MTSSLFLSNPISWFMSIERKLFFVRESSSPCEILDRTDEVAVLPI